MAGKNETKEYSMNATVYFNLSIRENDLAWMKAYAKKNKTSVAAIMREWISDFRKEVEGERSLHP